MDLFDLLLRLVDGDRRDLGRTHLLGHRRRRCGDDVRHFVVLERQEEQLERRRTFCGLFFVFVKEKHFEKFSAEIEVAFLKESTTFTHRQLFVL